MRSDQSTATENQDLGYGHIVVQDTAVAIGISAIPTPLTDGGSDFYVYELMNAQFLLKTAVGFDPSNFTRMTIDSKAARKVDFGQDIAIVAESGSGSAGLILFEGGRVLIKLH
jgi:hypothetical protein